jgi:hypothetical protein
VRLNSRAALRPRILRFACAPRNGSEVIVLGSYEAFIGIDTSKLRDAIAIAEGGRGGEVRYVGEIDSADAATRKLVSKLAVKYRSLTFCYEAGPAGYGLYRLIRSLSSSAWSQLPRSPLSAIFRRTTSDVRNPA